MQPDNIGFLADGTLQLFDFGLATTTPRPSSAHASCGDSPRWLASGSRAKTAASFLDATSLSDGDESKSDPSQQSQQG